MAKWEYKVVENNDKHKPFIEEWLSTLAQEGWELISVTNVWFGNYYYYYYFRRKIED